MVENWENQIDHTHTHTHTHTKKKIQNSQSGCEKF